MFADNLQWAIVVVLAILIVFIVFGKSDKSTEHLRGKRRNWFWQRFRPKIVDDLTQERNVFSGLYFDNNGTTQPHKAVVKTMSESAWLGNPSAQYAKMARDEIEQLKKLVHQHTKTNPETHQIVITSGASESNNLVIRGMIDKHALVVQKGAFQSPPHIVISNIEHHTSIQAVEDLMRLGRCTATFVAAEPDGTINPEAIGRSIRPETVLVSIMHANNETGAKNDIKRIGQICNSRHVVFHTDAVQTFGKYEIPMPSWNVDAVSMSFHKMNGPTGIGLLVAHRALLDGMPAQITGSQNNGLRGGTENVPAIAGAKTAMQITLNNRAEKNKQLRQMKQQLVDCLASKYPVLHYRHFAGQPDDWLPPSELSKNGSPVALVFLGPTHGSGLPVETMGDGYSDHQSSLTGTLPNTLLFSIVKIADLDASRSANASQSYNNFCNIKLKKALAENDAHISIGSACNTSSGSPSHVLAAINAPFVIRCGVIRVSMGDYNTTDQVQKLCNLLEKSINIQLE